MNHIKIKSISFIIYADRSGEKIWTKKCRKEKNFLMKKSFPFEFLMNHYNIHLGQSHFHVGTLDQEKRGKELMKKKNN